MNLGNRVSTLNLTLVVGKSYTNLLGVQLVLPLIWHVMCVLYHFRHEQLWVEHPVFLWYHPSRDRKNRPEHSQVKQYRPVFRHLEVNDEIWINDRCQQQDRGERASNERYESNMKMCDELDVDLNCMR